MAAWRERKGGREKRGEETTNLLFEFGFVRCFGCHLISSIDREV